VRPATRGACLAGKAGSGTGLSLPVRSGGPGRGTYKMNRLGYLEDFQKGSIAAKQ
jgi:hypothetical protein